MTVSIIPLVSTPSQTLAVVLAQQACRINVYQKTTGLFVDLFINDVLVVGGVLALNMVAIVRDAYLGFTGELAFVDLEGLEDPSYETLGTRFLLAYYS